MAESAPWQDYATVPAPGAPSAPHGAAQGPWSDYAAAPAVPDMTGVQNTVKGNLQKAQEPTAEGKTPEPLSHEDAIDTGLGIPVSKTLGIKNPNIKVPPALRQHLMDAYAKGTAVDAGDFMQSAIPATSQAVAQGPEGQQGTLSLMGQAAWLGIKKDIQDAAQAGQMLHGQTPTAAPENAPSQAQQLIEKPFEFGMPTAETGKKLAVKTAYGLAESVPEITGAIGGGALGGAIGGVVGKGPMAAITGTIGAGAGAAVVNYAKSIAPLYAEELKTNPDHQAAFDMAVKKAKISAAATGASFALFDLAPFKGAVKNVLFQALGVQPAVGAGEKAATNIAEGKPVTEGMAGAALQSGAGTVVPLVGMKLAHAAMDAVPTHNMKTMAGKALGKDPSNITQNDIVQAIKMSYENIAPKAQDFHDAATIVANEKLYRGNQKDKVAGEEAFLSPDKTVAAQYAGKEGTVTEHSANFKNLFTSDNWMEAKQKLGLPISATMPELISYAKSKGYDGLKFNTKTNGVEYIRLTSEAAPAAEAGVTAGPRPPQPSETTVAGTLRDVYTKTGVSPAQVIMDGRVNPKVYEDVKAGKVPDAYAEFSKMFDEHVAEQKAKAAAVSNLPPDHPEAPFVRGEADIGKPPPAAEKPFKSPILKFLADRGGVVVGSDLDARLRELDMGPGKKDTPVGLFKKEAEGGKVAGRASIDNIPVSEFNDQFDTHYLGDEHGNMKAEDVQEALRDETFGKKLGAEYEKQKENVSGEEEAIRQQDLKNEVFDHAQKMGITKAISNAEVDEMAKRYHDTGDIDDAVLSVLDRPGAAEEPTDPDKLAAYLSDEGGALTLKIPEAVKEFFSDIKRDILNFTTPMETGSNRARATAKDFANAIRWNQWNSSRIFKLLEERYSPEELKNMWNSLDASSDYAQKLEQGGMSRAEAIAKTEKDGIGHFALPEDQKAIVESLNKWARASWDHAVKLGMVEGEGFPFWTPRMAAVIGEDGTWQAPAGKGGLPAANVGKNLTTTAGSLKERKYETAAETEAAMKGLGEKGTLVRDIRTMPLALARFNQAIAGKALIKEIKDVGIRTGAETVSNAADKGFFTLEHPSFKTYQPKLVRDEDTGKWKVLNDENGDPIFEQKPLYISKEFEGPLKAVLSQDSGAAYKALMQLKGEAMGLIMYSPLIHNAVEWGRALPAMPGKIITFKVYFEGNKAKKDPEQMQEAIQAGLVPIGSRYFNQDISSIMETPDLTPGRGWAAKLLGGLTEATLGKGAGNAVKTAIDKFGDVYHNTLLWDRVADLQMGLYTNMRDAAIKDGLEPRAAQMYAAHMANRFAGALPMESMSNMARKIANVALFSRSFTIGNLGVLKDVVTGLPSDVMAQLEREIGPEAAGKAASKGRKKAFAAVALDIALMYAGNSILQDVFDHFIRNKSVNQIEQGYIDRYHKLLSDHKDSPWGLLNLKADAESLISTSTNEPGKENRIHFSDDPKTGTAYYMRMPTGKIGEEFLGWMTSPLDMVRKKASPVITKPALEAFANADYFGHPIYDKDAAGVAGSMESLGKVVTHIMKGLVPEDSIKSIYNILTDTKSKDIDWMKTGGPLVGLTFSKGYPGGPEAGIIADAVRKHEDAVSGALPKVKAAVEKGDPQAAREIMKDIGLTIREQNNIINHYKNPRGKVNTRSLSKFKRIASPEEKALMEAQKPVETAPEEGEQPPQ